MGRIPSSARKPIEVVLMAVTILGATTAGAMARFGSIGHALAYVRGERFYIDEPVKTLGAVEAGSHERRSHMRSFLSSSLFAISLALFSIGVAASQALADDCCCGVPSLVCDWIYDCTFRDSVNVRRRG